MDESDENRYCDKTLDQLKKCLRERGLRVSGKKKALIERLLFDDKTSQKDEPLPEFHMSLPDQKLYMDIHTDHLQNFSTVSKQRVCDFLASCDAVLDKKIELLYQQRYLRHIRFAVNDGNTFVTGVVWAEMKKTTSYKVDVCLDGNGVVHQTQCECAVGQGPSAHCKHVSCVLHALNQFCTTGVMLTEVTCTQVLQTFHRAKPHRGSPLKAKQLSQSRGKAATALYDPRPVHKRNPDKSEHLLRNVMLNLQVPCKWPVLQKYSPANIKALAHDHDYLELSLEDKFLREEKISHITKSETGDIEAKTRGQNSTGLWAMERKKRITSSNFGTVCKCTDRRDVNQLVRTWIEGVQIKSSAVRHGLKYERVAVEKFESVTDLKTTECGLFVSVSHPMLAASPDRIINEDLLVEVKCPFSARDQMISQTTVPYLTHTPDGELTLRRNHDYYYQVQGQLFCTGRNVCKFVVYTFKDIQIFDIPKDQGFIDTMLGKLLDFYRKVFREAVLQKFLYKNTDSYDFTQ